MKILLKKAIFRPSLQLQVKKPLFHANDEDGNLCSELLSTGQNGISAGVAVASIKKDGFLQIRKSRLIRPSWNCEYSSSYQVSLSRSDLWQCLFPSALSAKKTRYSQDQLSGTDCVSRKLSFSKKHLERFSHDTPGKYG